MSNPKYLTTNEVANLLRVPVVTLYAWRYRGFGPPAVKLGRSLLWPEKDLTGWLEDLKIEQLAVSR